MSDGPFRIFVPYAHADARLVCRFLECALPRLGILRGIEFDQWSDARLLAGEPWRSQLAKMIEEAELALLCMTPGFLHSEFVMNVEVPALVERGSVVVPVGLDEVDLARADLKCLSEHQIFRYQPDGGGRQRWFTDCRSKRDQGRFCNRLAREIADRMTCVTR